MIKALLVPILCIALVSGCGQKSSSDDDEGETTRSSSLAKEAGGVQKATGQTFFDAEPTEEMTMEEFRQAWDLFEEQVKDLKPEALGAQPGQEGFAEKYAAVTTEALTKLRSYMTMARKRMNRMDVTASEMRYGRRIAEEAEDLIDDINRSSAKMTQRLAIQTLEGEENTDIDGALLLLQKFRAQVIADEGREDYDLLVRILNDPALTASYRSGEEASDLQYEVRQMMTSGTHSLDEITSQFRAMIEALNASAPLVRANRGEEGVDDLKNEIAAYEADFELLKPMIRTHMPSFQFMTKHRAFSSDVDAKALTEQEVDEAAEWLCQSDAALWRRSVVDKDGKRPFKTGYDSIIGNAASSYLADFANNARRSGHRLSKAHLVGMPFAVIRMGFIDNRLEQLGQEDEQGKVWQSHDGRTKYSSYIYHGIIRNDYNEKCDLTVTEGVRRGQDRPSFNYELGPVRE